MPDTISPALPDIDPVWRTAVQQRVSRRRFDRRALAATEASRLGALCERLSSEAERARAVLVERVPDGVFTGIVGTYGRIDGAPALVVFVGKPDSDVDVGFIGEAVILDATAAGLDTCWIAGTFDAAKAAALVDLGVGESVRAVTPVGHAAERVGGAERVLRTFVRSSSRLDLEQIAPGSSSWPDWALAAAELVRLAPSGGNGQPWRLRMDGDALVVSCTPDKPYWTWGFDCGIAMLHAQLGAAHAGVSGAWKRLPEPDVACFMPDARP